MNVHRGMAYNPYVTHKDSVEVIRAWWRLERARAAFDAEVKRSTGASGSQVALLRIIDERAPVSLRDLRSDLDWHPASLGQAIQRLETRGFLSVSADPDDRRRRVCTLTPAGRDLLTSTPLVGPVRLRSAHIPADDLATMKRGFELALNAFGLDDWSPHD